MNSLENSFRAKERLLNPFKSNSSIFENQVRKEISVVVFGAKGDGVHDDSDAFQRALDADFGLIFVPRGKYCISKTLVIGAGTELRAAEGAILSFSPTPKEDSVPFVSNRKGEAFADEITISGGEWYDSTEMAGDEHELACTGAFCFEGVKRLSLEQIRFHGNQRAFCQLFHANGYRIRSCTLCDGEKKRGERFKDCNYPGVILQGYCYFGEISIQMEMQNPMVAIRMEADDPEMIGVRGVRSGPIDGLVAKIDGIGKEATIVMHSEKSTLRAIQVSSETILLQAQFNPQNAKGEISPKDAFMDIQVGESKVEGRRKEIAEDSDRIVESCILAGEGKCYITSLFGSRERHPVTGEEGVMHNGVDIVAYDGQFLLEADVCAWEDGVVSRSGYEEHAGYFVILEHSGGRKTKYFHLEQYSICVMQGQRVRRGDLLGRMGNTGYSTGEHLHFQLEQDGIAIEPSFVLKCQNPKGK